MKSLGAEIDEIVEAPPRLALDFSMPGMWLGAKESDPSAHRR
jgi:hypothetical protein